MKIESYFPLRCDNEVVNGLLSGPAQSYLIASLVNLTLGAIIFNPINVALSAVAWVLLDHIDTTKIKETGKQITPEGRKHFDIAAKVFLVAMIVFSFILPTSVVFLIALALPLLQYEIYQEGKPIEDWVCAKFSKKEQQLGKT